jgi:nitric oxide dioxygenase
VLSTPVSAGQHRGLTAETPPTLAPHRWCAAPAGDGLERNIVMATQLDITALETSFDLVAPKREQLVDRFYRRLFTDAPATRALFAHADMRAQKRALLGALVALRRSLRDLTSIAPFLADLGARHARYGVGAEHYPLVGAALLETMAEVAGAAWQPAFTTEWARAYQLVAQIMIDGAEQSAAAA